MSDEMAMTWFFLGGVVVFVIYMIPAMVSSIRNHPNKNAIYALNLLLGWTFIGWVLSLVWALTNPQRSADT